MSAITRRLLACAALAGATSVFAASPAPAPDMTKVFHYQFPVAETGFDPAQVHDLYSNTVIEAMFETLLTYDYLARPDRKSVV